MTYDTPHDDCQPCYTIKASYCWELYKEVISEGKELANKLHIKALENSVEKKIGCFSTENHFVTFDDGFMVIKCKYNQSNKLSFGDVQYCIPRILGFIKHQEPEIYRSCCRRYSVKMKKIRQGDGDGSLAIPCT